MVVGKPGAMMMDGAIGCLVIFRIVNNNRQMIACLVCSGTYFFGRMDALE